MRQGAATRYPGIISVSPAPAPAPPIQDALSVQHADDEQEHDRADERVHDHGDNAGAEKNVESRQQPMTDQGTQTAHDDVPDQAEARAPDQHAGKPAGDETDQNDDQQAFIRQMHG